MDWLHKVGWISCFLLIALLWMAHFLISPSHGSYSHFGTPIITAADSIMGTYCSSINAIGQALLVCINGSLCLDDLIFCPDTYFYWQFRAWFMYIYLKLSWHWWFILIYAWALIDNPPHRKKEGSTDTIGCLVGLNCLI